MSAKVRILVSICVALGFATHPAFAFAEAPCYATGDVNDNGITYEIADWVLLENFLTGRGGPPDPSYLGDVNGDGYLDWLDNEIVLCVIVGDCTPSEPIEVPCNTELVHGGCILPDTCVNLSAANCAAAGGTYLGDGTVCLCECGAFGDITGDGQANPVDVVFIVNLVYKATDGRIDPPSCLWATGDITCDGAVNPVDVVYYVNLIYKNYTIPPCATPCEP